MSINLRSVIVIFTVIDGKINVPTKNDDLINILCTDEIEKENKKYIMQHLKIDNLDLDQIYTFSKKDNNNINVDVLYADIVEFSSLKLDNAYTFKDINYFKNNKYLSKAILYLKEKMTFISTIKKLYPKEFVLPEIQKLYENLLQKKYDRRNFRKKLLKSGIIEPVDKMLEFKTGRPAKVYRFKEFYEDKIIL